MFRDSFNVQIIFEICPELHALPGVLSFPDESNSSVISGDVIMLDREFFLGFIKIHILYHASKEPIFGVGIAEKLTRHGYRISPGTLYPLLQRLEKEGYLQSSSRVVNGRTRRYYQATAEGELVLEQSRQRIREPVTEVIEEK